MYPSTFAEQAVADVDPAGHEYPAEHVVFVDVVGQ
jgi:hypothetical protein